MAKCYDAGSCDCGCKFCRTDRMTAKTHCRKHGKGCHIGCKGIHRATPHNKARGIERRESTKAAAKRVGRWLWDGK